MLALLFHLGNAMYAISCEKVREIVPMTPLKTVWHAPDFFVGFLNYRGRMVPVVDLRRLIQKIPCEERLSTRIILIDYPSAGGDSRILGLLAERVTETIRRPETLFLPPRDGDSSPCLKGFLMENDRMIQYVNLDALPESIGFPPDPEGGAGDG